MNSKSSRWHCFSRLRSQHKYKVEINKIEPTGAEFTNQENEQKDLFRTWSHTHQHI
jgi:hypothetical protein